MQSLEASSVERFLYKEVSAESPALRGLGLGLHRFSRRKERAHKLLTSRWLVQPSLSSTFRGGARRSGARGLSLTEGLRHFPRILQSWKATAWLPKKEFSLKCLTLLTQLAPSLGRRALVLTGSTGNPGLFCREGN